MSGTVLVQFISIAKIRRKTLNTPCPIAQWYASKHREQSRIQKDTADKLLDCAYSCFCSSKWSSSPDTVLGPPATESPSTCPSPQSLGICSNSCICRDAILWRSCGLSFPLTLHVSAIFSHTRTNWAIWFISKVGGTERTVPLHQCRSRAGSSPPHARELPKQQVIEKAAFSATWYENTILSPLHTC